MFFVAGFATAVWAALVPFAKANTGVDDSGLGLLLLCLGGGALLAMPASGAVTTRFGCRRVIALTVLLAGGILPLLATLGNVWGLALALLSFGIGIGTLDCAVNIQAILVEKAAGRPLMSGFHGFYSVGGIVGAGAMSAALSAGISPFFASLLAGAVLLALLAASSPGLLPYANSDDGPAFAVPRGVVLILGGICFASFLAEGSVLDWSAVFLTEHRAVPEARGGLGFACFSLTMTVGRLTGDRLVARFGSRQAVIGGALLAAAGLLLVIAVPAWPASLLGYALVGAGCSNIVPVMYTAIGRQTRMPQAAAVPAVSTLGYTGILAGPAIIGFISGASSLPAAFLVVVALLLGVAAVWRCVRL